MYYTNTLCKTNTAPSQLPCTDSGPGEDFYNVLRNKCSLYLRGEAGDDSFIVQTYATAIAGEDPMEGLG
jgi:hypothetical protein